MHFPRGCLGQQIQCLTIAKNGGRLASQSALRYSAPQCTALSWHELPTSHSRTPAYTMKRRCSCGNYTKCTHPALRRESKSIIPYPQECANARRSPRGTKRVHQRRFAAKDDSTNRTPSMTLASTERPGFKTDLPDIWELEASTPALAVELFIALMPIRHVDYMFQLSFTPNMLSCSASSAAMTSSSSPSTLQ